MMEEEKLSCKHCKKEGHDEEHCWQLHPNKRPKWSKGNKGKQKVATLIVPTDLGSKSGDEAQITVGLAGKYDDGLDFNNSCYNKR